MYDKFITYNDIFDGAEDSPESYEPKPWNVDPNIQQDLVTLFQMKEIDIQIENFIEYKEWKIRKLENDLHYTYNYFGERDDDESRKMRSRKIMEKVVWKEEVTLIKKQDKLDILMYIKQKWLIIDRLWYNEWDGEMVCLSVIICEVDQGDEEDDDSYIFIQPEFVLNKTGHVQTWEEDMSLEIFLDDIKEIVVDDVRYVFPL